MNKEELDEEKLPNFYESEEDENEDFYDEDFNEDQFDDKETFQAEDN